MLLFLSHSGADTAAAVALRARILAAPAAREAGLDVWLDVEELRPGEPWRPQLEAALQRCTAFAVLLGSQGIVNWVDAEVGVALDRATTGAKIPFIPIRASDDVDWDRLPPFARQFQGLTDPLGDVAALAQLIAAATGQGRAPVAVTDRPFVGLQAMGEAEADRFFGRDAEIDGLADLVRRHPVTAVVADSGAGKSSLVRAGLIPAFRGGRLADPVPGAAEKTRLAIVMRPGDNPALGLRLGVERAARDLALGPADIAALRHDIDLADADKTVFALACHQGPDKTDILLVVDQFEELLTQTGDAEAAAFVDLLLALSQPSPLRSVRIVLTVRADYFNLISAHPRLFQALTDDDGAYEFRTIQPGPYPWANGGNDWRPAHIHFSIFGSGFAQRLITQMYFEGDPLIAQCPIVGAIPDRAAVETLVAELDMTRTVPMDACAWRFDIVLRGRRQTMFENRLEGL